MVSHPDLWQVALSTVDLKLTEAWFREGLGLLPSGGSRAMMNMEFSGKVQGLPGARSTCWWMVADNARFQLELFQFSRPTMRLLPDDWRVSDVGYTRMGLHVEDFDGTLARLARLGTLPERPVAGEAGARRAVVRSPDGVFVELMEADPMPDHPRRSRGAGAVVRTVGLTTPDLAASIGYFHAITGREAVLDTGNPGENDTIYGLENARCRRARMVCGDVTLEISQYENPVSRPWPTDHRISDQGILNLGFGVHSRSEHDEAYRRMRAFGAIPNREPLHMGVLGLVYVNDPLGFSAEVLWTRPGFDAGYEPAPAEKRPQAGNRKLAAQASFAASPARVWAALSDSTALATWLSAGTGVDIAVDGPVLAGRGTRYRVALGKEDLVVEVTHATPERLIGLRIVSGGPFEYFNGLVTLAPDGAGTRLVSKLSYRSRGLLDGWKIQRGLPAWLSRLTNDILMKFIETYPLD